MGWSLLELIKLNMKKYNHIIQYIRGTPDCSISEQMAVIKNYSDTQNWNLEITEGFVDENVSANSDYQERPGLNDVVKSIRSGGVNILIVSKLDRLFRNQRKLLEFIEILNKENVALVSATESFNTETPNGRLMFQILGSFAQHEREMIKVRGGKSCCGVD